MSLSFEKGMLDKAGGGQGTLWVDDIEARAITPGVSLTQATLGNIFLASHTAHALGTAWGLAYYLFHPDWKWQAPPRLTD